MDNKPAVDVNAIVAAVLAAMQQAAPAAPAAPVAVTKAAKAAPAAAATPAADTIFQLHQIGKAYPTKGGNVGVAVRGKTSDGKTVGGNLWIKQ